METIERERRVDHLEFTETFGNDPGVPLEHGVEITMPIGEVSTSFDQLVSATACSDIPMIRSSTNRRREDPSG